VDKRISPPSVVLENGQTVEVITEPDAYPSPNWLNFVVTARARSSIRHRLRSLEKDQAIALGKRLLKRTLKDEGMVLADVSDTQIIRTLKEYNIKDLNSLLHQIGLGNRVPALVARDLVNRGKGWLRNGKTWRLNKPKTWNWKKTDRPLKIKGTEGMVVEFAQCCRPVPGDPIVGLINSGKGMTIHLEICPRTKGIRNKRKRSISLQWADQVEGEFTTTIRVLTMNKRGVLAKMATEISAMDSNIVQVDVSEHDNLSTQVTFSISVRDRKHLADIMRKLRSIKEVMKIQRMVGLKPAKNTH